MNENKITIFPNNLQLDRTYSENNNINRDYLVYAGRISEEKGVKELIETFIESNLKELKLKIIGKGPNLDSLKKIYQNNKIEFIGEKTNKEVAIYNIKVTCCYYDKALRRATSSFM